MNKSTFSLAVSWLLAAYLISNCSQHHESGGQQSQDQGAPVTKGSSNSSRHPADYRGPLEPGGRRIISRFQAISEKLRTVQWAGSSANANALSMIEKVRMWASISIWMSGSPWPAGRYGVINECPPNVPPHECPMIWWPALADCARVEGPLTAYITWDGNFHIVEQAGIPFLIESVRQRSTATETVVEIDGMQNAHIVK